ncbi:MAG: FixH family protein [Campylobacterota bacterium]|nr:FixH family protein [Campylobacterota bacterium]
MKDSKALRWPYGIALSFILIIGLIYATIVVSLEYPIEPSDRNMLNYHVYDKNVNDIILKKIAFDKLYNLSYVGKDISTAHTKIEYELTDKSGNVVNNAIFKAMITRPDNHKDDIALENPKVTDGLYSFEVVTLPKEGRWNILASVTIGEHLRFLNLKADTRYSEIFEY